MDFLNKIIADALDAHHLHTYPLSDFTIEQLDALTELARKNMVKVELQAEHSNFFQGVLVVVYHYPLPWKPDFNLFPKEGEQND